MLRIHLKKAKEDKRVQVTLGSSFFFFYRVPSFIKQRLHLRLFSQKAVAEQSFGWGGG